MMQNWFKIITINNEDDCKYMKYIKYIINGYVYVELKKKSMLYNIG